MLFVPATTGLLCILMAAQSTYKFSQHCYLFTIQGRYYSFFPHVDGNGSDPLLPDTME